MPKITKEDLRRDLFLARRVGEALQQKIGVLEELVFVLKTNAETALLNARTIWALSQEEGGWSSDDVE